MNKLWSYEQALLLTSSEYAVSTSFLYDLLSISHRATFTTNGGIHSPERFSVQSSADVYVFSAVIVSIWCLSIIIALWSIISLDHRSCSGSCRLNCFFVFALFSTFSCFYSISKSDRTTKQKVWFSLSVYGYNRYTFTKLFLKPSLQIGWFIIIRYQRIKCFKHVK